VIAVAARWIGSLSDQRLVFSLRYHADQQPDELRRYWGERLGIDGELIRLQRKSNSGQLR